MSFLRIDKSVLRNTPRAITMEILETNKLGTYSSMSIAGCNTRKYHGLFVSPVKNLGNDLHVLLSSLDESVVLDGVEFRLGLHQYQRGFEPEGNKYLLQLSYDKVPCFLYKIGDVVLSKELLVVSSESRVLVRYTLLKSSSNSISLSFKPNLVFRNVNTLCQSNFNATTGCTKIDNGVYTCLYSGYPNLYMQFNHKVEFVSRPEWNLNVEYYHEQNRGYNFREDLFSPGFFSLNLSEGQSVVFSAGLSEIETKDLNLLFEEELDKKLPNDSFKSTLRNSALKMVLKKGTKEIYLKSGYPWFGCKARDMFVSLPGITLPFGDYKMFESVMNSVSSTISGFIDGKGNKTILGDFDHPDVLLWIVRAVQLYSEKKGIEETWQKYGDLLLRIVGFYKEGKHPLVESHKNGLIYVKEGWRRPITWMEALTPDSMPITPRSGYVVEINSLWYNSLRFVAQILDKVNDHKQAKELNDVADKLRGSFSAVFWNETYLFDFVDGNHKELSVRPNMLFAVALTYSPLDEVQKKLVVDMATKELLTPNGIRSLSPHSQNYHGFCGGDQVTRDYEAFQGGVYPWLMGAYVDAYLKVYHESGLDFVQKAMGAFTQELFGGCLGTLSEMYDATQPFLGRGGMSYLMNIAEILRATSVLEK